MSALAASLAGRRGLIAALAIAIAAAIGISVMNDRGMFGRSPGSSAVPGVVRNSVQAGVNSLKAVGDSVASLFDSRSPGERAAGVLANMKQRKGPGLHQRALPKIRKNPVNPLAGIVGAVPTPPVEAPPIAPPLDKVLNGAPSGPVAISPPPGGTIGGPGGGGFPGVFVPGGGGGGVIIPPPAVNPPVTPPVVTPPTTSGVPEPSTWAMMLLGFLLIGTAARRPQARSAIA